MYVSDLALTDFRSYPELLLGFEPGVSAFIGRNGAGKTNIVESIGYLANFSSHRVAGDVALVRQGAAAAVVRAKARTGHRETLVEVEIVSGKANRARVNRNATRTREAAGLVTSVVFAPEDLELVKGDPQPRRRFLDDLLTLRTPRLAGVRSDYEKILRQRSALLKSAGPAHRRGSVPSEMLATLDVWDAQLARVGAELTSARIRLMGSLRPHVAQAYDAVSGGGGPAKLSYRSSLRSVAGDGEIPEDDEAAFLEIAAVEAQLIEAITRLRGKELDRGVSLVGPHRDDLLLALGSLPAKGYASHGESWSIALALRLASFELLRAEHDSGDPVLVLDDVFAELDARRRSQLAQFVAGAEQVFITAAASEDVPEVLSGVRYRVADGAVVSEGRAGD